MHNKLIASLFFCGGLMLTAAADSDDLHLNGHFRGALPGAVIAPGWTASAGAVTRLLPDKPGKAILEVSAPANAATVVVSGLHEVRGNLLKLKVEIQGRGTASIGFEAFDAYRNRVIASDRRQFPLGARFHDAKTTFDLNIPDIRYIRISLTADPGSVVRFRDVEAEFKIVSVAPPPPVIPAPVAPPPPPAPPAPVAPPPPAVVPAVPIPAATLTIFDDRFYAFHRLRPVEVAHVLLPYGSDIEFDLEEHHRRRIFWQVEGYDPAVCRVKLEHDRGHGPGRPDKAEIEIKGIAPGFSKVTLSGGGKRVIVYVTVR